MNYMLIKFWNKFSCIPLKCVNPDIQAGCCCFYILIIKYFFSRGPTVCECVSAAWEVLTAWVSHNTWNTRICHFNPSSSSLPAKNHVSVLLCQQACLCGVNYHCMLKIIPMLWYDTLHVFQHQLCNMIESGLSAWSGGLAYWGWLVLTPVYLAVSVGWGNVRCVWW